MKRSMTKAAVSDSSFRYRVRYESEEATLGTPDYRREQTGLLKTLLENQGLLDCGPQVFETLKMFHDGTKWVIELESTA